MIELSGALSRRILPYLCESLKPYGGLHDWLDSDSFYMEHARGHSGVRFRNIDLRRFVDSTSVDYRRLALASLESYLGAGPSTDRPRAIGWPLLKLYYSAFFGAHAMMRATGRGVIWIDGSKARRITKIAKLYDPTLKLDPGGHEFELEQLTDRTLDLVVTPVANSGGTHEQFWHHFARFLSDIAVEVAGRKEPEAHLIAADVSKIRDVMAANGRESRLAWLAIMRNRINYQHDFGVWFPYGAAKSVAQFVASVRRKDSASIRLDYDIDKQPMERFVGCCHLLAEISLDLGQSLCARSGVGEHARQWARLLRELRA